MKSPELLRYEIKQRAKARKAKVMQATWDSAVALNLKNKRANLKVIIARDRMDEAQHCLTGFLDFKHKVQLKYSIAKEYVKARDEYFKLTGAK